MSAWPRGSWIKSRRTGNGGGGSTWAPRGGDDALPPRIRRRRLRRRQQARRLPHRLALALLVLPLVIVGGSMVAAALGGAAAVESTCSLNALRPLRIGENSFVFASDGSLLGSIPSSRNRQPLKLREMTRWIPKATVAIEDRRFYEHGGLDYKGILRAAVTDIQKGTFAQGGSTITQQLVRNLYIGNDQRTLERKLREACLALRLAASWSRNRVLSTYLNQVYYGNHAYGIEAAAQTYFSRSARRLSLAQSALLAGLPQAPSVYDPFDEPKVALKRRNDVLRAMLDSHYIGPAQFHSAAREPLGLKPGSIYTNNGPWDVHNSADESAGTMSLMEATAHSVNTIFAQLAVKVGPSEVVKWAHRIGISSPLQAVCSITLGTQPVSPLEMTSAFGTFAAHGIRHHPQSLELVRAANGRVLTGAVPSGYRVIQANTADLVTAALQGVVTHGTGTAANIGRPAAGKTGTAENYQGAGFCGYVPQLVTCVWVGYPHRELSMQYIEGYAAVFGGTIPASIWHD